MDDPSSLIFINGRAGEELDDDGPGRLRGTPVDLTLQFPGFRALQWLFLVADTREALFGKIVRISAWAGHGKGEGLKSQKYYVRKWNKMTFLLDHF